ncbi:hypothetical protein ZIOFF_006162 [Zingiber officinale]|uniref:HMA domain-containing protein n=1 Tax=Zingiber officinale TaxID=94328 RepID=A0A8J5HV93_ZINOF|nr:hypothetical protein ZIOFF_006162 [Zingiber officinale]
MPVISRGATISVLGSVRYLLSGDEEEDGVTINDDAYLEEIEKDFAPLVLLDLPTLRALMSKPVGFKVVALRVSLHYKGCEGKVRKHISKMEGVTSFEIDFASKKVMVMGDMTPLGVLSNISKLMRAQF